jgi:hypothetical protein
MKCCDCRALLTSMLDASFAVIVITTAIAVVSLPSYLGSSWKCMSTSSIVLVCIISLFGGGAAFRQLRIAYRQMVADNEDFMHAKRRFERLGDGEKETLERLVRDESIDQDSVDHAKHLALLNSGFVIRDGIAGRFSFLPNCKRTVAMLVKEWRAASQRANTPAI